MPSSPEPSSQVGQRCFEHRELVKVKVKVGAVDVTLLSSPEPSLLMGLRCFGHRELAKVKV